MACDAVEVGIVAESSVEDVAGTAVESVVRKNSDTRDDKSVVVTAARKRHGRRESEGDGELEEVLAKMCEDLPNDDLQCGGQQRRCRCWCKEGRWRAREVNAEAVQCVVLVVEVVPESGLPPFERLSREKVPNT